MIFSLTSRSRYIDTHHSRAARRFSVSDFSHTRQGQARKFYYRTTAAITSPHASLRRPLSRRKNGRLKERFIAAHDASHAMPATHAAAKSLGIYATRRGKRMRAIGNAWCKRHDVFTIATMPSGARRAV